LSQRALAKKLGVSQPRVVKLESGEHNPEVDTIINAVRRFNAAVTGFTYPVWEREGPFTAAEAEIYLTPAREVARRRRTPRLPAAGAAWSVGPPT
jgi:transcriptional regulator with XRE-family HTH domain